MEGYPLSNSDDEENPTNISSSDTDEEPFIGFDIRDIREVLPVGQATTLFESKPKKNNRFKRTDEQLTAWWYDEEVESDEEVEGEIAFSQNVSPEAYETCMENNFDNCEFSKESEDEVDGEIAKEIFSFNKPILDTARDISSNSDIEGELCDIKALQATKEKQEEVTLPNVVVTMAETLPKDDKSSTHTVKGKSRILSCDDLHGSQCKCQRKCLHRLTLEQMKMARQRFTEDYPTFEKERKFILNWFADNEPLPRQFAFTISGIGVCWRAWTAVLGITETRFYLLKRDFINGRRNPDHGSSGAVRESLKTEYCRNFLEKYFKECCDYLPNSSTWHLTSSSKKCEIYEEMKATFSTMGQPVCSRATFRNIWKGEFSHVKIPKENRFSKCDVCCHLKEELRAKKCPAEKVLLKERRRDHIKFVREERKSYMERGSLGHHEPSKYLSIAIDGMDTKKTELPYSRHRYGSEVKAWHLKVHLVGVLIHGRHPICMHDFHEYPHDSNLTMNILLQVLWIHRDNLPRTLFIQMDNTCKENKNQYVLSFLAYLVEMEVFDKIEVSFLPVGHTHIDVDQMLSRLSVALQRAGCLTYKDLLLMLRRCYTQTQGETTQEGARPQYARTSTVYAIREWLLPHMKGVHRLHNFHAFSILRLEGKKTVMLCRPWCVSQYDPVAHPPITLLKSKPQGVPELVKPDYQAVDLERIRGMVKKCVDVGVFRDDEEREWRTFLEREERLAATFIDVEERTYLHKDQDGYKYHKKDLTYMECVNDTWIVDELKDRPRVTPQENVQLSSVLQRSADLERGDGLLPVYTGPYRRPGQVEREVITNQDPKDIDVGMLVAIDLDKYRERPLIAKVKETKDDKLVVAWMAGSWTTPWSVCKRWTGRTREEWLEEVSRESIILFDFELTPTGKLRSASIKELKNSYGISD